MSKREYKKINIIATDWNAYNCQEDIDFDFQPTEVEITGNLLREDEDNVIVALEIFHREQDARRTLVIPKINIKKRKYLT